MASRHIRVRAFPEAKKEKVIETGEDTFDMYIREPAQQNLANYRIRELVAQVCNANLAAVRFVSGHRSLQKTLTITTN